MVKKEKKKVFVALSGGVDSSVAALLLKKRGYDVIGVHMRCYNLDGCGEKDARDAKRAADALKIPFYVFNFEKEYKKSVVDYMVGGYRAGITPNPDVMCNKEIKFGLFLKKALAMGADCVATGHYVKIKKSIRQPADKNKNNNSKSKIIYKLYQARDGNKDQSYFLWTLNQERLRRCLFPIGGYLKSEVRQMARRAGLPAADKKDSQGVCFIGKISLPEFLNSEIPAKKGPVLNLKGEKIGEHGGAHLFTVGQRHGIKISAKKPLYVVSKNVRTNTLVATEGSDHPSLYKEGVILRGVNFINPAASFVSSLIRANRRIAVNGETGTKMEVEARAGARIFARVRYRQPLFPAEISKLRNGRYKLVFDKPQKFIAAGQSAVFYAKSGEVLGGGVIA